MANSLFTELSACEATSLVGGARFAIATGTFGSFASSNQGQTDPTGNVTTSATLDGDNAQSSSSGFSGSFAGED